MRRPDDFTKPWRYRPRQGGPRCLFEQLLQHLWANRILYYVAVVATISLALQVWLAGLP